MVVYSVVIELTAAITGDRLFFSGIFLKGEKLWASVFHEAEMEVHSRALFTFLVGLHISTVSLPQGDTSWPS